MLGIVAADKDVVENGEVGRAGPVGENAHVYIFEAAVLDGKPAGAGDELSAGPDGDLGVPESDPLEIIVVGGLHIEEIEIAAAVEDHFAISGGLNDDGLVGRAAGKQVVSAFHRGGGADAAIAGVEFGVIAVGAGMDQDDVAGP